MDRPKHYDDVMSMISKILAISWPNCTISEYVDDPHDVGYFIYLRLPGFHEDWQPSTFIEYYKIIETNRQKGIDGVFDYFTHVMDDLIKDCIRRDIGSLGNNPPETRKKSTDGDGVTKDASRV